ncbi:FAD-binding oxidoreductase [Halorubellus litoreus]|uniref:FAD-binding oxidoreductase n=1 Tax=Halorubellus litoreus TaxID=755308 RepID=A0ABD5VBQ4_9EURY
MASIDTGRADRDALETDVHGTVHWPGDPEYDDARRVWNAMIDRRPAVVVRCRGVADVRSALAFARADDRAVCVRGGGHNVAGTAIADDAVVVDLSDLTAVGVDPDARTAWVQGGATWADVDHETQAFGLATPGGVVSETGVGGLTLGGGIGHLRRRYGLACDNVRAVDLVTADGEYVHATDDSHPDVLWALRGGARSLGVVTAFEYDLHPVGPDVATCFVVYDARDAPEVMRQYRDWAATAPDAVSTLTAAGVIPDAELFPATVLDDSKLAVLGCHAGDPATGQDELAPLREFATPLADESGVRAYADFQQLLDEDYPDGMRYYWKSLYLDGLPDAAVDRLLDWAERAPSPLSTVDVWHLGGAIDDADPPASAYPARDAPWLLGVEANWEDPAADDANVAWVRECLTDLSEFTDGAFYVNFPGFFESYDESMRATFGDAYERLKAVVGEYDPNGLFAGGGPTEADDPGTATQDDPGAATD